MTRQYKLISQESYCLTVGLYSTDRMSRPNPTNLITYTNTLVPSEISYFQGFFNILQITSSNISQSVSYETRLVGMKNTGVVNRVNNVSDLYSMLSFC